MKIVKQALLFGTGFAGGFLTYHLSFNHQASGQLKKRREAANKTMLRFTRVLKESRQRLNAMNNRLKRELKDPIPDLYRATDSLSLTEDELIYD